MVVGADGELPLPWLAAPLAEVLGQQRGHSLLLPKLHAPLDIMVWLQQMQKTPEKAPHAKFILLPQGAVSMHTQTKPHGNAVLLVGAEGGFTQAESDAALHCGFIPIRMGARVLRTETAAIAGLAALQTLWGDF